MTKLHWLKDHAWLLCATVVLLICEVAAPSPSEQGEL